MANIASKQLPIASNLLFLIPWLLALVVQEVVFIILIPAILIVSTMYHVAKPLGQDWWHKKHQYPIQSILLYLDTIVVSVAGLHVFYLFYLEGFPPMFWFLIILGTFPVYAYWTWKGAYYEYGHTLWHMYAAVTMTAVLL